MLPKNRTISSPDKPRLALALCALTAGGMLCAEEASKLQTNSPFLPPDYHSAKTKVALPVPQSYGPVARELEFRGVVQFKGVYEFSLFNKTEQRGYWIPENQSESGITVRAFDADSMSITVNLDGRSERLTLMSATDNPLPVAISPKTTAAKPSHLPNVPGLNANIDITDQKRRVIPRRRVVLPQK